MDGWRTDGRTQYLDPLVSLHLGGLDSKKQNEGENLHHLIEHTTSNKQYYKEILFVISDILLY